MRVGIIAEAVAPGFVRLCRSGRSCTGRPDGKRRAALRAARFIRVIGAFVVSFYLSAAHVAWAVEELAFDLTVSSSGFGPKTVTGRVALDDGKFDAFFDQSGVKLHLSGKLVGDALSMYGSIKTGFIFTPCGFRVDGPFKEGRFEQRYMTTSGAVDSYRGVIVIRREVGDDVAAGMTGN